MKPKRDVNEEEFSQLKSLCYYKGDLKKESN